MKLSDVEDGEKKKIHELSRVVSIAQSCWYYFRGSNSCLNSFSTQISWNFERSSRWSWERNSRALFMLARQHKKIPELWCGQKFYASLAGCTQSAWSRRRIPHIQQLHEWRIFNFHLQWQFLWRKFQHEREWVAAIAEKTFPALGLISLTVLIDFWVHAISKMCKVRCECATRLCIFHHLLLNLIDCYRAGNFSENITVIPIIKVR